MNAQLLAIVKRIIAEQGEYILSDPRRLKPFIKKYAHNVPIEERRALGRCIENGAYSVLKTAQDVAERSSRKAAFALRLRTSLGLDTRLSAEALDVLEAALYGSAQPLRPLSAPSPAARTRPPQNPPGLFKRAVQGLARSANRLPRFSKRARKGIIAAVTAAAALAIILIAARYSSVAAFTPIVEFNGEAYPSKIIATAGIDSMLGGGSRMIETETYFGDALGDFGVQLRSASHGSIVRIEIEGDYCIQKSVYETKLATEKTVELFPRINYNYTALEAIKEPRVETVTFSLYVNDKQKRKETLNVPFHRIDDEPVWDASRNGNKTLHNYHFVVVLKQAERIEQELAKAREEAEAEAARRREAESRATAAERRAAEAEAARRREAERRAAERAAQITDLYNDKRIWDTLAKVHSNIYDVNRDGKTNCVDYSNLFYHYSPFKSTSIVVNFNRSTNFNHQFNAVMINGHIVFVEPQASRGRSYDLRQYWGAQYNPRYNQMDNTTWLFLPRRVSGTEE